MHRFAAWGLSAALAAGAAVPSAVAADPPAKPWYARVLGSGSDTSSESKKTFADLPPRPPVAVAPLDPSVLTQALRAEQDAWQRRMEVCHKLREIAAQANDDRLFTQADDLEREATALYHQRVVRLGVKAPPRGAAADADRQLVSGPSDLPALAPPAPASKPAAPARQFREVQP